MTRAITLILLLIVIMTSCSRGGHDPELARVAEIVTSDPQRAVTMLDTIDAGRLNDADRHYRDLLAVKASDKAYITHTSDSLILSVIDYYSTRHDPALYAEALYYGGRVYSGLGDLPTALLYYRQAYDNLPEELKNSELESEILKRVSQITYPLTIASSIRDHFLLFHGLFFNGEDKATRVMDSIHVENERNIEATRKLMSNYKIHFREHEMESETNRRLMIWCAALVILILIMGIIILWIRNRNQKEIIKLRSAIDNITLLEELISHDKMEDSDIPPSNPEETATELQERLRQKLLAIYNNNDSSFSVCPQILQSEAFSRLQQYISAGKILKESDELWDQLEAAVLKCSPNFKTNLMLLVGGRLNSYDLHTSILIKCGVLPSQMAVLLNRSKGTIVSRRESLSQRIFEKKLGTKVIDGIIRLL